LGRCDHRPASKQVLGLWVKVLKRHRGGMIWIN
jgi:hypothetical protein